MKYEKMRDYGEKKFRRITGMHKITYKRIVGIIRGAEKERRSKGGRKPKLTVEDMVLAAIEYWREYRTYAHIAVGFELSESQIFRIVKWVENIVISDGTFSLPGKKAMLDRATEYGVVLLDATETPIERPKKTGNAVKRRSRTVKTSRNVGIQVRRSVTR